MNPFIWKDEFLRSYKRKHEMIQALVMYVESNSIQDGVVQHNIAIEINTIINWNDNRKENLRAVRYLISGGYFLYSKNNEKEFIQITESGLTAFNSEQFLTQYKEQLRLRNNNRWMIALNVIVAVGVLYSIYKDEFKKSPLSRDKETGKLLVIPNSETQNKIPNNQFRSENDSVASSFDSTKKRF